MANRADVVSTTGACQPTEKLARWWTLARRCHHSNHRASYGYPRRASVADKKATQTRRACGDTPQLPARVASRTPLRKPVRLWGSWGDLFKNSPSRFKRIIGNAGNAPVDSVPHDAFPMARRNAGLAPD